MGYTLPPPTGPSSSSTTMPTPLENAQRLIALKSSIESSLQTQISILKSHNADMSTPLVDPAGFPRADIDIVTVRTARVRIIELRNDLARVLEEVKIALEEVHAANASNAEQEKNADDDVQMDDNINETESLTPFARVDAVAPGSPADLAGLKREDLLLSFGSITSSSLSSSSNTSSQSPLTALAALATSHENRSLILKVLRSSSTNTNSGPLSLTLTPRKWSGRGLLGCHIVPYTSPPSSS